MPHVHPHALWRCRAAHGPDRMRLPMQSTTASRRATRSTLATLATEGWWTCPSGRVGGSVAGSGLAREGGDVRSRSSQPAGWLLLPSALTLAPQQSHRPLATACVQCSASALPLLPHSAGGAAGWQKQWAGVHLVYGTCGAGIMYQASWMHAAVLRVRAIGPPSGFDLIINSVCLCLCAMREPLAGIQPHPTSSNPPTCCAR